MLIKEIIKPTETGIEIHKKYDNNVYLDEVKEMRKQGVGMTGENRLVGRIPMHLVSQWVKEAGIKWSDTEAKKDLIHKKMLSGEFNAFRVWKGTY